MVRQYSLCQNIYIINFLFIFKIESQNIKIQIWNVDVLTQKIKINELMTTNQLDFSANKWELISFFLMIIQLWKNFSRDENYVLFINNFFINTRLFKVLRIRNIEVVDTIKINSNFLIKLMIIRAAASKQKNWKKTNFMINKSNKKMIDDEDVLCIIWMNNNIVQFVFIVHIIDEIKWWYLKT